MTLELSRLKPNDYEILDSGAYRIPGKVVGVDSPEFGDAATDYIEMVISTPTGVFLDSFVIARGDECTQYKTLDENNQDIFSINPGVFMREKGYFSGEYNIEFNFLREVAGSEQGVLVDRENKIYNGTFFVSNKGLIYKGGEANPDELEKDEFLLREKDYKFFVDEISADRTEVRLATLPIKSGRYNTEFKGLGSDEIVLDYNKTLQDTGDKIFEIPDLQSNTLPQNIIGGELVIRDAYKVPGLNINKDTFDALVGLNVTNPRPKGTRAVPGLMTYGGALRQHSTTTYNLLDAGQNSAETEHTQIYGGDNDYYANTRTENFYGKSNIKRETRGGYTSTDILQLAQSNNLDGLRNLLFHNLGTGKNQSLNFTEMTKVFRDEKLTKPNKKFYDGAALIGWTSYVTYGFPLWIRCNSPELNKFVSGDDLKTTISVRVSGRSVTKDESGNTGTYGVYEINDIPFGNDGFDIESGENTFIRIPRHPEYKLKKDSGEQNDIQGAIFDMEIDFNVKFEDVERTYTIIKPSVFGVVPDDDGDRAKTFIQKGFE
jgi:hypothetical protein